MSQEETWEEEDLGPSKSQLKREMAAIQELAERLTQMGGEELRSLGLDGQVEKAIADARKQKPSSGRKRQIKYIAKLINQDDVLDRIQGHFDQQDAAVQERNRQFHQLEQWRDRLIADQDDALQALLAEHPHLDRQALRQLVRNAAREKEAGKSLGSAKKLFRFLRENIQ